MRSVFQSEAQKRQLKKTPNILETWRMEVFDLVESESELNFGEFWLYRSKTRTGLKISFYLVIFQTLSGLGASD